MATKAALWGALILATGISACTDRVNSNSTIQTKDLITLKKSNMKNLVSIIEIPTSNLKRAIKFYSSILSVNIEEAEMGEVKMGILPGEEELVNVVLVNGNDYKPTTAGCVLYLNGGDNLQDVLNKIEPNGGKVIVPKTIISPEMGYFALFIDTEGNKLGLHSQK